MGQDISFYEDNYNTSSDGYFLIAWEFSKKILLCSEEYSKLVSCGTFMEIHRPLELTIIQEMQIFYDIDGFDFMYFPTYNLCAGKYEVKKSTSLLSYLA